MIFELNPFLVLISELFVPRISSLLSSKSSESSYSIFKHFSLLYVEIGFNSFSFGPANILGLSSIVTFSLIPSNNSNCPPDIFNDFFIP